MPKEKDSNYSLSYGISVIVALLLDYLLFSRITMSSTMHVALGFLVFTVMVSISTSVLKKFK